MRALVDGQPPKVSHFLVIYSKGSWEQQLSYSSFTRICKYFFLKFYLEEFCFCFKCFLLLLSICILFSFFIYPPRSKYYGDVSIFFRFSCCPMPGTQKPELHSKRTTKCCREILIPPNYADLELDPAKFTNLGGNKKHMKEL